jgi:hypothetical protein
MQAVTTAEFDLGSGSFRLATFTAPGMISADLPALVFRAQRRASPFKLLRATGQKRPTPGQFLPFVPRVVFRGRVCGCAAMCHPPDSFVVRCARAANGTARALPATSRTSGRASPRWELGFCAVLLGSVC